MASTRPNVFVDVNIFVDISEKRQGWNNSLEVIAGIRKEKYMAQRLQYLNSVIPTVEIFMIIKVN